MVLDFRSRLPVMLLIELTGLSRYIAEGGPVHDGAELSAIASLIASAATLIAALTALIPYLRRREKRNREEQQQLIELVIQQMERRDRDHPTPKKKGGRNARPDLGEDDRGGTPSAGEGAA